MPRWRDDPVSHELHAELENDDNGGFFARCADGPREPGVSEHYTVYVGQHTALNEMGFFSALPCDQIHAFIGWVNEHTCNPMDQAAITSVGRMCYLAVTGPLISDGDAEQFAHLEMTEKNVRILRDLLNRFLDGSDSPEGWKLRN